jgi:hypothetical protein
VADYSEWKTGRRFTGMVFATIGFALKSGLALGSASFLWIMAGFFNYDTKLPDAPQAVQGYRACSGIVVGILFAVCTVLLIAYQSQQAPDHPDGRRTGRTPQKIRHRLKMFMKILASVGIMGIFLAASGFAQTTLKEAFKNDFLIGAALNEAQFTGGTRNAEAALVKAQFDTISPENVLKWESIHPGRISMIFPRRTVRGVRSKKRNVHRRAHLVWHSQTPKWVFQDDQGNPVDRDALLLRMSNHIFTVVGRYKGKIGGWDVVNEALDDDGTLRQSEWEKIIGPDYIIKAYQFAHEADPQAQLYYNDYSLENAPKRKAPLR